MSLMTKVPPRVRISSRTFGNSSESMMCPESSTSSTCGIASTISSPRQDFAVRPAVPVRLAGAVQRAVPKDLHDHQLRQVRQRALFNGPNRSLNVVLDAL